MSLSFTNVSHHYVSDRTEERWQLQDITLTVEPGEIVTLFGPSGCGKTTLLRLAAGMEVLQEGEIRLGQTILSGQAIHTPPEKRPLSFVFQDYVLFPHLTVMENITFGLKHLTRADRTEIARTRLQALRLEGLEKRYPYELSGGQQQRVALARALARNPQAILMDEPFASIGANLRTELQKEIRSVLQADQFATLFVTHDPDEALMMGDRVALLKAGKLLEIASPQDLFEQPQSFEAALMFPGTQAVAATLQNGIINTAFGVCAVPRTLEQKAVHAADGPVTLIVSPRAVMIEPTEESALTIQDCRCMGEYWIHFIQHRKSGDIIRTHQNKPIPPGTPIRTAMQAEEIRFFDQKG